MSSKFKDDNDDSNNVYLSCEITENDRKLIEEIKETLGDDYIKNNEEINAFPDTLHDLKLLRMLRGFNNDVNKIVKIFKEANKMRAKYGWGERRKQMEEIDANEVDGLKLTENITRTNKKHWLRYLDPNKNDMDAREKYLPNVIGYTESDAKYTVKGTPYVYNPYCIFDTPKCK